MATWTISPAVSGLAELPLYGDSEWKAQGPRKAFRPGIGYAIYAWSHRDDPLVGFAVFTLAGLKKLKRGQVWIGAGLGKDYADPNAVGFIAPLKDFGPCT